MDVYKSSCFTGTPQNICLAEAKEFVSKYSIRDFIMFLSDIRKAKVNNEWLLEPIIDKQKTNRKY